jgi:DNA-binding transcriptional regulator YdaS (Cro superfamily)
MNEIQALIKSVGSQSELARRLNVSPQAVQQWVSDGAIPIRRCVQIESVFHGEFTAKQLNPDFFTPQKI